MQFTLSIQQRFVNYEQGSNVGEAQVYYIPFTHFNSILKNNIKDVFQEEIPDKKHYININNYSYYNYSFDENINLHKNGKAELNFKMLKYILLESNFVINPFINKIRIGSIISYQDFSFFDEDNNINGKTRLFLVTGINYKFNKTNIEYSYSCQDYFSYINTRKNSGYNIQENIKGIISTDTVNNWATKIQRDCSMEYSYVNLSTIQNDSFLNSILNKVITFSISNSNAYNALVSLAEKVGLIIEVDDNNINPRFWFKLEKNPEYQGLLYSPHTDIKDFSLSQSGQTLTSVINVNNVTRGNKNIGLLSDIPMKLIQYFNSSEWGDENHLNTKFYPGLYKDIALKLGLWEIVTDSTGIKKEKIDSRLDNFLTILDKIPWLEPKIIKLDYMLKNNLLTKKEYVDLWDKLSNDLRIINGKMLYYQTNYYDFLKSSTKWISENNEKLINYGGAFQKDIINQIEPHDEQLRIARSIDYPGNDSDFGKQYKYLYTKTLPKTVLVNYNNLVEEYGNKLIQANQEFLKNIFLFKKKFEDIPKKSILSDISTNDDYDLTLYWDAAYNISYLSDYFLPKNWKITLFPDDNYSEENYNSFIPSVTQTFIENSYVHYKLAKTISNENSALQTLNNIYDAWKWCGEGEKIKEYYYTIESNENQYFWNSIINNWTDKSTINGINRIFLNLLAQNTTSDNNAKLQSNLQSDLNKYIQLHNDKWADIYRKFGHILLEQTYQDDISINSAELYNNAMRYFEDLSNPENQFNLSIIGISSLKGYKGRRLEISDQIRLAADDFYDELDNLKEIIKQPLFITDISYNLRSDESIKLTVNTIKYQDKIIQRLVSLIK